MPYSRAPPLERLGRGAPVEAAVHLGASAGAATLGVRDRRESEGDRDAAGAVLAVHLLQRERHDRTLLDPRPLLDHDHVEAGLGEDRRRGGAAGSRSDDQDVAVVADRCGHDAAPVLVVAGHVSHTNA